MSSAAIFPVTPSTASALDLITMGQDWAKEKKEETPLVAVTLQAVFAIAIPLHQVVQGTDLEELSSHLAPTIAQIRTDYPDTTSFVSLVNQFPAPLFLIHHIKNASTLVRVMDTADQLAKLTIPLSKEEEEGKTTTTTVDRERCQLITQTSAGLWLVFDQAMVRTDTKGKVAQVQDAFHTLIRSMISSS